MNPEEVVPRTFKVFQSGCHAIVLNTRGETDPQICVTLLTEDDENWFISKSGQFDSAWLLSVRTLFSKALSWIAENCDPSIHDNRQYGWKKR